MPQWFIQYKGKFWKCTTTPLNETLGVREVSKPKSPDIAEGIERMDLETRKIFLKMINGKV